MKRGREEISRQLIVVFRYGSGLNSMIGRIVSAIASTYTTQLDYNNLQSFLANHSLLGYQFSSQALESIQVR